MVHRLITGAVAVVGLLGAFGCRSADGTRDDDLVEVAFQIGAVEFSAGDSIRIDGVFGDRPELEPGGRYVVRGAYILESRSEANLLLSVTAHEDAPQSRGSSLALTRGRGTFELTMDLNGSGWPHLTMYDLETGKPFSGMYFGLGSTLLVEKSWRYDSRP